jgi:hypothetical protein
MVITAASVAYLNNAVERTGHTTGFFPMRVAVACGPPLTASVGQPEAILIRYPSTEV